MTAGPETSFYLVQLEGQLRAAVELRPSVDADVWLLVLRFSFDGQPAGATSFTLRGYGRDEAEHLAGNIRQHAGMMKAIDEYLWGDSD